MITPEEKTRKEMARLRRATADMLATLDQIAGIAEGSTTANSLPHIARLARGAIIKATTGAVV
jgi:uncharacterized protein (DUF2342 family)